MDIFCTERMGRIWLPSAKCGIFGIRLDERIGDLH
jgi:hypothetical protein